MYDIPMNEFQAKIGVGQRQVRYGRYAGTNRDIPVRREDNGAIGGFHTEHWSGRVDATIIAPTIRKTLSMGDVD